MKPEEIQEAAKEAGGTELRPYDYGAEVDRLIMTFYSLNRFAAIIEKRTIERCAVVCERLISGDGICADDGVWIHDCAAAIRKLGEQ